ncbi:MAG: putative porin, partial [Cyclobacteriaceae bacterium]
MEAQIDPERQKEGDPFGQNDPFGNPQILEEQDTTNNRPSGRILGGEKEAKSPYGPSTTRYFTEEEYFREDSTFHYVDTTLAGLHRFEVIERLEQKYQNLGANGTAMNPIFPVAPTTIGRTPGFTVYDPYALPADSVRYYDTRSPYTKMHLVFGGNNRNLVDLIYSRNINSRWNIAGHMYRIITDKQIGASARRDDRNAVLNRYGFNTSYRSEDGKYALLGSFVRSKLDIEELGGIVPPSTGVISDFYDTDNVSIELNGADASELRQDYHLYHQYILSPILQVYHRLDRRNQVNSYRDPLSTDDLAYYPNIFIRSDTTTDRFKFREFSNEIGIKGKIEEALFYAFYYKRRDVNFINRYLQNDPFDTEHYIGGKLRTDLNERTYLSAEAEYLEGGNYRAKATVYSPWAVVGLTRMLRKPAYLEERFFGNHYSWDNDLSTETVDQLEGNIIV